VGFVRTCILDRFFRRYYANRHGDVPAAYTLQPLHPLAYLSLYHTSLPYLSTYSSYFFLLPTMATMLYSCELTDHIRIGPSELILNMPLRFHRRRDFNDFLQALETSETIEHVSCAAHLDLGLSEDEWVLLVETLGRIRDIKNLEFNILASGSRENFHPFQTVADAVNNAQSLHAVNLCLESHEFIADDSGLTAFANAIREHKNLEEVQLCDYSRKVEAAQSALLDPVLRALSACPHFTMVFVMTACASSSAMQELLQLGPTTDLRLKVNTEHWLAVADGIRQGHCTIKNLHLALLLQKSSSKATEAMKAVASAIREDSCLEYLELEMKKYFTNAAGVALAEALTVNTTLCELTLTLDPVRRRIDLQNVDSMSAPAYDAFCAMLRVNTGLTLDLPPFDFAGCDEKLIDSVNRMRIEQELNGVGRGRLLSSSQTEGWVRAMDDLNLYTNDDETPEFNVSCLYSLLRLNPSVCLLDHNYDYTTSSGL
jgi:hypothetical protein